MISACVLTYNGAKYIREQLVSILSQLGEKDQVIVSDDGSSDRTLEIVRELCDSRIEIYRHEPIISSYVGVFNVMYLINRNMNNALKYAKGDYIFLADQDDIWLDGKVSKLVEILNSGVDCVVHDCKVINDSLEVISDSFYDYLPPHRGFWGTLIRSSFMGCCMAFNRKVLERAYPIPTLPIEHDTWIGLCALKVGGVKIIDDKLILYRRHSDNVSSCSEGSRNSLYIKIKRRFYMLWCFLFK